eukprot:Skav202432  [mRNA]  locus=scaffold5371:97420:98829:- [translate_table: standard]
MATQRLQDVLSFLSSLGGLRDGQPQEVQRRLVEGCLRDLMQGPGILLSEATEMANMVNAATLPGWMRDEMLQAVHDKVLGQNNGATKRRNPMQRNMRLYNYFTAEEWEVMRSDTQSLTMKLHTLKKRFQSIGLTCPAEPTCVLANVILHLATHHGPPEDFQVDARKAIKVLKDVKAVIKLGSKRGTPHSGIEIYPANPTDLPQPLRGNAYSQPAVPCPLDIPSLDRLVQVFPARDTHGDVRHVASGRSSVRDDGFKGMLCNALMERFLSGVGGARNSPEGLLMIENGPSYKRKKSALALEDGSVHDHEEKDCKKVKCDEVEIAEKPSETQEPQTQKAKSAEEMAQTIRDQLEANKEKNKSEDNGNVPKTTKPKAKTKAKATAKSKAAQIKTAGSEEHYTVKTLKSKGCPGTKAASPYHLEHATVYTCPNSHSWRVKKCGDKKDRAFSWKKEDPKLTWKRVMGYLEEISA